ncbi:hypothetical protein BGZ49_002656 [Haplosporangium sp. Z 27]|nr:hypothetical protein BGZ49_002656 [Haplosporangium sp. Z 27]
MEYIRSNQLRIRDRHSRYTIKSSLPPSPSPSPSTIVLCSQNIIAATFQRRINQGKSRSSPRLTSISFFPNLRNRRSVAENERDSEPNDRFDSTASFSLLPKKSNCDDDDGKSDADNVDEDSDDQRMDLRIDHSCRHREISARDSDAIENEGRRQIRSRYWSTAGGGDSDISDISQLAAFFESKSIVVSASLVLPALYSETVEKEARKRRLERDAAKRRQESEMSNQDLPNNSTATEKEKKG